MAVYNFKKQTKLYIVYGGFQYNIEIADITFSQVFTENSHKVKTIHTQTDVFEASVINTANPANFTFNVLSLKESDLDIVYDLLFDYDQSSVDLQLKQYDMYIKTELDVFKLEGAVSTGGTFSISKTEPLGLEITGAAKKLSRVGPSSSYTIPGTPVSRSVTKTFIITKHLDITFGADLITKGIYSASIELQNNINWDKYRTVQGALSANTPGTSMYPESYTLESRVLAGSFSRYLQDKTYLMTWDEDIPLRIQAGHHDGGVLYGFDFNMGNCSVTSRMAAGDVFTESFDWRLTQNPTSLNSIINYNT